MKTNVRKWFGKASRRILCLLLAVTLLCPLLGALSQPAAASNGPIKEEVSRTIAIVFDNSGSMYYQGNKAWSQAIYAMEVFASMMNEGDTLMIYPMHEVTVGDVTYRGRPMEQDGKTPAELNPLVIRSKADVPSIRDIYTPYAGATPVDTISYALEGLRGTSADEEWLILLTDGDSFNDRSGAALNPNPTKTLLENELSLCAEEVNVLYLGIGIEKKLVPEVSSGQYSYYGTNALNSADVLKELSGLCNRIFGRDALPEVGRTVSFDIPISKLIVLAQGESVDKVSLKNASGSEIGDIISEYNLHYSTTGTGRYDKNVTDTSLQGVIVTYRDIPIGDYTLDCGGVIPTVYYEPDVDLAVMLIDENGQQVKAGAQCHPGTYRLVYGLVDNNGRFTDSALLGDKQFTISYTIDGTEHVITDTKSGEKTLELAVGASLDVLRAKATYLSGYTIEKNGEVLGWPPNGFAISARPAGVFDMTVSGGQGSYQLAELEEKGLYYISLLYENQQLTGAGLDAAELQVTVEGGNLKYDLTRTEEGYTLALKYSGAAADTYCCEYTVRFTGAYTNEDGQTAPLNAQDLIFSVEDKTETLTMNVNTTQNFFVISRISEGEPIVVTLEKNGQPLTDEELSNTQFTAEANNGMKLLTEPVSGQSAYLVRIDPESANNSGFYKLTFRASTPDSVGRELTAEGSDQVELQNYPRWLRTLIIILIILLILLLIWLYLNAKVLPKKIAVARTTFTVDGSPVKGTANCVYTGGKKKKGSLDISAPKYSPNPLVKCGFHLELEAMSPRRTKSASRAVRVVSVTPTNANAVDSVKVGTAQFIKGERGRLTKVGGKPNAPIDFRLATNAKCNVGGEVQSPDGGTTSISLAVTLKFY